MDHTELWAYSDLLVVVAGMHTYRKTFLQLKFWILFGKYFATKQYNLLPRSLGTIFDCI